MSDIFTELGHAVLDARHNNTPRATASAALDTLLGNLPPLPPHVALITETAWAEVAAVAISPEGKIAVLGIEPDGTKEIIEWKVIDRRWTSRVIASTDAEMRVDHLHYPQDSEDVAFSVTTPHGEEGLFWGEWKADLGNSAGLDDEGLLCFIGEDGRHYCVAAAWNGRKSSYTLLEEAASGEDGEWSEFLPAGERIKILGTFAGRIAILRTREEQQSVRLADAGDRSEYWDSDWYDQILPDSIMERDGELSFVGWNAGRQGRTESGTFLVNPSKVQSFGVLDAPVFCLQSGRILTFKHDGTGDSRLVLHDIGGDKEYYDADGNGRINLDPDVSRILEIVEIPSGLVIQVIMRDGTHRLLIVHETDDSVPGVLTLTTTSTDSKLRRWDDHLIWQTGMLGQETMWVMHVDEVDTSKATLGPLHTPFERLFPTEEGILGWHFVNGTFYIFRYPLPE